MAWLPDGEKISKISLFVLAQLTNVTDGRTDRQTDRQTDGHRVPAVAALMHSIARQKSQSNGPLYSNTVIATLALMGALLHLVQREGAWAGCAPPQSPRRCTKYNSPPISDQCTNFILFDIAL